MTVGVIIDYVFKRALQNFLKSSWSENNPSVQKFAIFNKLEFKKNQTFHLNCLIFYVSMRVKKSSCMKQLKRVSVLEDIIDRLDSDLHLSAICENND